MQWMLGSMHHLTGVVRVAAVLCGCVSQLLLLCAIAGQLSIVWWDQLCGWIHQNNHWHAEVYKLYAHVSSGSSCCVVKSVCWCPPSTVWLLRTSFPSSQAKCRSCVHWKETHLLLSVFSEQSLLFPVLYLCEFVCLQPAGRVAGSCEWWGLHTSTIRVTHEVHTWECFSIAGNSPCLHPTWRANTTAI